MIVHLTTVHPRYDVRIMLKEIATLVGEFSEKVVLIVADGKGAELVELEAAKVQIIDLGRSRFGRLGRFTVAQCKAVWQTLKLRPQVVHFHDPELILISFVFRLLGIVVVYDVHEDVPRQILSKYWLPEFSRRSIAAVTSIVEKLAGYSLSAIVVATPTIAKRFPSSKTTCVQNFVALSDLVTSAGVRMGDRSSQFAYVGVISESRGIFEVVSAIECVNQNRELRLSLAGYFSPSGLEQKIKAHPGWKNIDYVGFASRKDVGQILGSARAGLLLLHPLANHVDSQPVKMFEYMAAGLPIIASDFPLWRNILGDTGCGILVNPQSVDDVVRAMNWILDHPNEAEEMGEKGRIAVKLRYNWNPEGVKLSDLYRSLLLAKKVRKT